MTTLLLLIGAGIIALIFAKSFFTFMFSMQNHGTHKERLKQLQQAENGTEKDSDTSAQLVSAITKPIITYLLPNLKVKDTEQLELDLKIAGWDKTFDATQYRAMNLLLKITGVIAFIALFPVSKFFALVFGLLFFFLFGFLFKNSIKNKKAALFNQFPDFIRIIQGYLMANIPLTKAVEETIPYVGPDWQPILKDFVLNCNIYSVPEAIDTLCDNVNIFEIREFFALVKLNMEQGINVKESFESQATKVGELQMEVMLSKINQRQMMAVVVQAPLLLCMFAAAGLPTFHSMMNFTTL